MTTASYLTLLSRQGIHLRLDGERLVSEAPAGLLTPEILGELRLRKNEIVSFLGQVKGAGEVARTSIPRAARGQRLPLSFGQQRLWFLDQIEPVPGLYVVYLFLRMSGHLDIDLLHKSLETIVRRHEALRTTFPSIDGIPYQSVADVKDLARSWEWEVEALDAPVDVDAELDRRISTELRRPFNLEAGPLFRARAYVLGTEEHVLLVSMHHIVSDGWSLGIFQRELSTVYAALQSGSTPQLVELPLQYVDFAAWQRLGLEDGSFAEDLAYWGRCLANLPALDMPSDRPRLPIQSFRGAQHCVCLDPDIVHALRTLGQREGCSLFVTLMAAMQILLHRYTGQDDFAVGAPVACRNRAQTEHMMGVFVNTLVLRADFSGVPSFRDCLRRVRDKTIAAQVHQDLPFERVVEALQPKRDLGRNALFQVMFNFASVSDAEEVALPDVNVRSLVGDTGTAKFDLTLALQERSRAGVVTLEGLWEYATDLFDEDTITRMHVHYETLLRGLVASPDAPVSTVAMVPEAERQRLLVDWNATSRTIQPETCIHHLVEDQAAVSPRRIAAKGGDWQLTYAELDSRANRLAHHLRAIGVGSETLVGVSLPRTRDLLVVLLAIFKAGGAYLPLDPEFPPERLTYMLTHGQAPVLVTCTTLLDSLLPAFAGHVVCLDRDEPEIGAQPDVRPPCSTTPGQLAYTIYTSGSTGRPKGVEVTHGNVVNCLRALTDRPGLCADDVLLALTTLSFDISVLELFGPLSVGACVALATRETASAGEQLRPFLEQTGATVMQATPATWRMLLEAGWPGDPDLRVWVGGEALRADLARRLYAVCREVWNMYGPTETTVWSTCARITDANAPITIGTPIGNTRVYVLDARQQIVPVRVPGELYIGGAGVTRGYRHQPDLTAERFVPDPFSAEPGARLYRTGDRVRFQRDGSLEYLARLDNQVKVQGFRIELGEIEAALSDLPEIKDAAVGVRSGGQGDARLLAYVVYHAGQQLTMTEVRRHLRNRLPVYMVPGLVTQLDALPQTPNGKIDRAALPDPFSTAVPASQYSPPQSPAERIVAEAWEALLPGTRAGRHDNFFELGGHSLLSMRAVAAIRERSGKPLDPRLMFFHTLEQIAAMMEPERTAELA